MPELLIPTTIYSQVVKELLNEVPVLGMAHITGGGIPENLPRCFPSSLAPKVDYSSWERPELFNKIQEAGDIEESELRRVFNLGIGFCLVIPEEVVIDTQGIISNHGMKSWVIGEVIDGSGRPN